MKTGQFAKNKFEQTIDYGSKIFNEGVDTVSQTAGKVKDDALDAVSGLFHDKPSQTQTPSQAPKPTEVKPIQTTEQNQRSQENGTPKVVVSTKGDCVCQGYDLIWGAHPNVTCEFRKKVVEICKDLWPDNYLQMANNLMAVFDWESGETFRADAPNQANSGGTGLIQIMPSTYRGLAKQMGLKNTEPTIEYVRNYWKNGKRLQRIKQLAQMSEIEQLDWVKQYFSHTKGKNLNLLIFISKFYFLYHLAYQSM